jgi:hypothetical protein
MSRDDTQDRLAQLAAVLETHGANEERWPDVMRAQLATLVAEDDRAARLLAEARALNKLLAFAPVGRGEGGLEARILAAASALPQQAAGSARVRKPSYGQSNEGRLVRIAQPVRSALRIWPELTLLAASLFIGLLIGLSGQAVPTLQNIAEIADEQGLGTLTSLLFDPGDSPEQGAL